MKIANIASNWAGPEEYQFLSHIEHGRRKKNHIAAVMVKTIANESCRRFADKFDLFFWLSAICPISHIRPVGPIAQNNGRSLAEKWDNWPIVLPRMAATTPRLARSVRTFARIGREDSSIRDDSRVRRCDHGPEQGPGRPRGSCSIGARR